MNINRAWAMPNKNTFAIKPIKELINSKILTLRVKKTLIGGGLIIDPFANQGKIADMCDMTNDLDEKMPTTHHMEALGFLKTFADASVDMILFDPPYSPRQVSECYKKLGKTVNMQTTQASYWGDLKKEIARIAKNDCIVITCGWNSGGIGKGLGFQIEEILLVAHGGWHNDTIVTVERKVMQ